MKRFFLVGLGAAAAILTGPAAFAQVAATVVQDTGPIIFEGPATSRPIRGAVIAQTPAIVAAPGTVAVVPNTTVLGGPAAVVTTTTPASTVVVSHYWNVPANIGNRMDFQRWQRLWP